MQPNENLTFLHLVGFTACLFAIFAWGLICLEAELARHPVTIAAAE